MTTFFVFFIAATTTPVGILRVKLENLNQGSKVDYKCKASTKRREIKETFTPLALGGPFSSFLKGKLDYSM